MTVTSLVNQTVVCDMNAETLAMNKDGGDVRSRCNKGLAKAHKHKTLANLHMKDKKGSKEVVCSNCVRGGAILCCCGKGCQRRYHPSCVNLPFNYIPLGFWHCIRCIKKKIELGVHSVSEGVSTILDFTEEGSNNNVMQRKYLVKYHGLAHAHNLWILESELLLEAPKLLAKFKRKLQIPNFQVRWKKDWKIPHRLLLKREIVLSKQNDQHFDGHGDNGSICRYEWLVKWTGLGYDNVTWELDDASFLTSPEGMKLIYDYESCRQRADRLPKNHFEANKERKASFAELSELPYGESPGFYNQHLSYVNKLRMCWHEGQSAVIADDQIDQERVMKVILFILSLNCNVKRPFLIISTSTALSVWETEFLNLAPSTNMVVYKGNRGVRSGIRALEFLNEYDDILFQILLSSSDVIVEDLHALRCIPWEAIIIDECQRSRILGHLGNINILKAEMRLLLVSGQIKEDRADYIKLLSFLHGSNIAQMEAYISGSISTLKSQLEKYVVFKCKSDSTKFVEYWVPACLSSLQLEQYCSMLLSNLMLLCSGQKSDSVDALHNLIISTRKCCDHPYLLDPTLHSFVTKGLPVEKHLNIDIKASGKLQLLEKILLEARSRQLRVLILFQSTCGSGSIGDILDDVLCQRFGKDCYVRYDRSYAPKTKQAALDTFNDKEIGKFVFLMENRACLSSVKLSSVDTVILFDSDLDPQNDLRGLQRMSISSQFKQFSVFRLYSYFTVEEKVLMLAKEGIALDSNVRLMSLNTCHTLLNWGNSYLFNKLDELHASVTSVSTPDIADLSLLSDVFCELSSQLVCGADDTDCHGLSFITIIQQNEGEYARNSLLLGERIMKKLGSKPSAFSWSDLEGRHPPWKFLSVSSQRIRKTVRQFDHILTESEFENDTFIGKRTTSKDNVDPKRRKVSKDNVDPMWRRLTKDKVDPMRRKVSKDFVETNGRKVLNHAIDPKTWEVSADIVDSKGRKVSKNIADAKCQKTRLKSKKNPSVVIRASKSNGNSKGLSNALDSTVHPLTNETAQATATSMQFTEKKKLLDIPNSINCLPKPNISGLCDILHFSKNVKAVAERIVEHIFKHYNVNCQEVSTVQAFEISVCWLAASLLKHKIDRKDSLALAKLYLNFNCKEEEATDVYSELWKHVKEFSNYLQNGICVEKCDVNGASDSNKPELNDLAEKQKDFLGTCASKLVKSVTNEHDLQMKTPPTGVSQDQTNEVCLSPKTPSSFPVEADAISMESCSEDDGMNSMTLIRAEYSSIEHWSNDVNPVTGSLEIKSPVRSTDITQSDGIVSEDPHFLVNEDVATDNAMNTFTHPVQLDSVEIDAVTCVSAAVPEGRQSYSVMGPVSGESTAQMAMSAIPSSPEHNAVSTDRPLDDIFYLSSEDNCYIHEAEVILEEPVNSFFVSPVILQPFNGVLMNENTTHVPGRINIPGYMNSDNSQAYSVTPEMSHLAYPDPLPGEMERTENGNEEAFTDPLLIEMERIEKVNEEASKIHEQKLLQLQSDYKKEFEKLSEKYKILLENVNTEATLKGMELEKQCKLVLRNKVLAEVWIHSERDVAQWTDQVFLSATAMPGSHLTAQDKVNHSRNQQC
ncbi:chromodomain-helicase-DNA-binding protein 3 isoform X2 [Cajanus cajan]|uniref:chromodomain-helicase-DNA-binding protein 3 isoform X2 n=1 Tax=Cajanus cajan TaxID=3821 RepID=UPI00098DA9DD|nr:chromodomain-helicase-DNA-binding protein 3 isoform X2 [Cajanus cajan]